MHRTEERLRRTETYENTTMMSTTIVAGAVSRSATTTIVSKVGASAFACESEGGLNPRNVRRASLGRPGRARIRANRTINTFV